MKFFYRLRCLLCFCLLCLTVCLASCGISRTPEATTDQPEAENRTAATSEIDWDLIESQLFEANGIPLEPDKTDLPSYAVLSGVVPGMTKEEAFALVGNPQRMDIVLMPVAPGRSSAHETICYVYDSSDGRSLYVKWGRIGSVDSDLVVLNTSPGN